MTRGEIDAFLSRLLGRAPVVSTAPDGTADIHTTAKKVRRTLVEIVQAILRGKLDCIGRRDSATGFASVLVNIEQARVATKLEAPPGVPASVLARRMQTSTKNITQLIRLGSLRAITVINPVNRNPLRIIEFSEIERFQKEYISLYHLAQSAGQSMPAINSDLRKKGVTAVDFTGVSTTFYRREDVQSVSGRRRLITDDGTSLT